MPTFRVIVHGQGLVIRHAWIFRRRLGFYATRIVNAESVEQAGRRALRHFRGDPGLAFAALEAPALAVERIDRAEDHTGGHPSEQVIFYSSDTVNASTR